MPFAEMRIDRFVDALAAKDAVPGGGGAAALAGALGAALVSMVCNLTLGKPQADDKALLSMRAQSTRLAAELQHMIDADGDAYGTVMAAYRLPRGCVKEKVARREAIQNALKVATEAPLDIAYASVAAGRLAKIAIELGTRWAVSDAAAAALLADAATQAALLNVDVNLGSIRDAAFVEAKQAERIAVAAESQALCASALASVQARLATR